MSERIYNTDKVVDQIGLKNQIQYDKIDAFVDIANKNNVWCIVYYTDYKNNKKISRQEIKNFHNYQEMINFIRNNFNGYELTHQVDYFHKKIYFHDVDYINIDYYLHEGKPHLNYFELNYKEYVNGDYHIRKMKFPREYETMFFNIIKNNSKMANNGLLAKDLINTIDVNAKKEKDNDNYEIIGERKRVSRSTKMPNMVSTKKTKKSIKNLVILTSAISLVAGTTGYKIVKSNQYHADILTFKNSPRNLSDISFQFNENKAGAIIEDLFDGNYENVSENDLRYVVKYIREVEQGNYDYNASLSMFNYTDYFSDRMFANNPKILNYQESKLVTEKIEKLYNRCFKIIDNHAYLDKEAAREYIDYVLSLTFMYDTNVDTRNSGQVKMNTQSITSNYATQKEIYQYNNYPLILKYIILNQLQTILTKSDYSVKDQPSNYFKGLEKGDLIDEIKTRKDNVFDQMRIECNNHHKNK